MMGCAKIWIREIARWTYWFPLRYIVHALPARAAGKVGCFFGHFLYCLSMGMKAKMLSGVRDLFRADRGDEACRRIARDTFCNATADAVERLHCDRLNKEVMDKLVELRGAENLDRALSTGQGAILMHAHFGNEELIMPTIGYHGYRMNQLASRWEPEPMNDPRLALPDRIRKVIYRLKIGTRENYPVSFVYIDGFLRDAFRCLNRNEVLAMAIDGREGRKWLKIPLLGKRWLLSPGPMELALRSGAPVVPAFMLREGNTGKHVLVLHDIFDLVRTGDDKEDIRVNTERFASILEQYVTEHPEQYMKLFWFDADFYLSEKEELE